MRSGYKRSHIISIQKSVLKVPFYPKGGEFSQISILGACFPWKFGLPETKTWNTKVYSLLLHSTFFGADWPSQLAHFRWGKMGSFQGAEKVFFFGPSRVMAILGKDLPC